VQPAVVPYTTEAAYDGRTYVVTVRELKAPRCEKCGELVLDSAANLQITDSLRQQLGLLTPEQIRQNREVLGLTQRQLASHLGIAEATLSRWETGGQIQQRALDRLLRLYFSSAGVREALADEERLAELGTAVGPHGGTEGGLRPGSEASPSAAPIRRLVAALRQHLTAKPVRDSLQELLRASRLPPDQSEANLSALPDFVGPMVVWFFTTDQKSRDFWKHRVQSRLLHGSAAPAQPGTEDRWFVAPLCAFGPEDAEQATRLSGLANALDALPPTKRKSVAEQFQQFMDLMK
jgi:putative zinc finger/helix-turn-helix YgiT family protein